MFCLNLSDIAVCVCVCTCVTAVGLEGSSTFCWDGIHFAVQRDFRIITGLEAT